MQRGGCGGGWYFQSTLLESTTLTHPSVNPAFLCFICPKQQFFSLLSTQAARLQLPPLSQAWGLQVQSNYKYLAPTTLQLCCIFICTLIVCTGSIAFTLSRLGNGFASLSSPSPSPQLSG